MLHGLFLLAAPALDAVQEGAALRSRDAASLAKAIGASSGIAKTSRTSQISERSHSSSPNRYACVWDAEIQAIQHASS